MEETPTVQYDKLTTQQLYDKCNELLGIKSMHNLFLIGSIMKLQSPVGYDNITTANYVLTQIIDRTATVSTSTKLSRTKAIFSNVANIFASSTREKFYADSLRPMYISLLEFDDVIKGIHEDALKENIPIQIVDANVFIAIAFLFYTNGLLAGQTESFSYKLTKAYYEFAVVTLITYANFAKSKYLELLRYFRLLPDYLSEFTLEMNSEMERESLIDVFIYMGITYLRTYHLAVTEEQYATLKRVLQDIFRTFIKVRAISGGAIEVGAVSINTNSETVCGMHSDNKECDIASAKIMDRYPPDSGNKSEFEYLVKMYTRSHSAAHLGHLDRCLEKVIQTIQKSREDYDTRFFVISWMMLSSGGSMSALLGKKDAGKDVGKDAGKDAGVTRDTMQYYTNLTRVYVAQKLETTPFDSWMFWLFQNNAVANAGVWLLQNISAWMLAKDDPRKNAPMQSLNIPRIQAEYCPDMFYNLDKFFRRSFISMYKLDISPEPNPTAPDSVFKLATMFARILGCAPNKMHGGRKRRTKRGRRRRVNTRKKISAYRR
jgi:hypothetical protein